MRHHDADVPAVPEVVGTDAHPETDTHGEVPPLTPTAEELGIVLPADPGAARDELLRLLADARHDAAAEADHALRAVAELDNIRKRTLRERSHMIELATERLVTQLLPVVDSFEAGLATEPADEATAALLAGFGAVRDQLLAVLAAEGVARIPTDHTVFDPSVHEAVSVLGEGDPLVVLHEMRSGWTLGSKVVRPASVVVGPGLDDDGATVDTGEQRSD
jgi:molecular chaperone GrpE